MFFLVDHDNPMEFNTKNVPPQRRSWWLEEVNRDSVWSSKLPRELRDLIFDWVDDLKRSMDERKYIQLDHDWIMFDHPWEH